MIRLATFAVLSLALASPVLAKEKKSDAEANPLSAIAKALTPDPDAKPPVAPPNKAGAPVSVEPQEAVADPAVAPVPATRGAQTRIPSSLDSLVSKHAAAHGVPESLVRRVIHRESRGNPRAVNAGNYGLMQIRLGTARAMGYSGGIEGLLDADTNMTYAVKYLAGAYRVADGNPDLAVRYYAAGYYYVAKRKGIAGRDMAGQELAGQESAGRAAANTLASASDGATDGFGGEPAASSFRPGRN